MSLLCKLSSKKRKRVLVCSKRQQDTARQTMMRSCVNYHVSFYFDLCHMGRIMMHHHAVHIAESIQVRFSIQWRLPRTIMQPWPASDQPSLASHQAPKPNHKGGTAIWRHKLDGGTCGQARPGPHTTPIHRAGGWDKTKSKLCQQMFNHTWAAGTKLANSLQPPDQTLHASKHANTACRGGTLVAS